MTGGLASDPAVMVIAVISDTHLPRGARRLPEACVERLRSADAIVHAGDFAGRSFLADLRALGPPVHAVHGNMDEPAVRDELPHEHVVELGGARIGLVHDAGPANGRAERLVRRFPGCGVIVFGHTHVPETTRSGEVWVLNPGSPTERRRAPSRAMILLEVRAGELRPRLIELATA